jgi:hypothetical protein
MSQSYCKPRTCVVCWEMYCYCRKCDHYDNTNLLLPSQKERYKSTLAAFETHHTANCTIVARPTASSSRTDSQSPTLLRLFDPMALSTEANACSIAGSTIIRSIGNRCSPRRIVGSRIHDSGSLLKSLGSSAWSNIDIKL